MLIRNIQNQHHSWNVKSTCNWHYLKLQMHGFLHIVSKGEMCITSHNPLWRSMVYHRIMTATFLCQLCKYHGRISLIVYKILHGLCRTQQKKCRLQPVVSGHILVPVSNIPVWAISVFFSFTLITILEILLSLPLKIR